MSPTALINGRVLLDQGVVDSFAVLVAAGNIAGVVPHDDAVLAEMASYDLNGNLLAPGFIDCQVNGGGGVLFNDTPDVGTIRKIATAHRRYGTTAMLPTLISDTPGKMRRAIEAVDSAIAEGVSGIIGIHLEGPFLSPARRGIHDASMFHAPSADDLELVRSLHNGVTLLTLAPERVTPAVVKILASRGVIVSAGHTAADYLTTRSALDAGLRGFTHLFNAMTPLQSREPGVVGAALDDAGSWCGLIVDGHHVHAATLRVAMAAKQRGKLFLVTDAMPPVGTGEPSFELNGQTITCHDGRCTNADGTLAGSALDMASAVRNTIRLLGVAPDEALRMASAYPADFLGISDSRGRIAEGLRADLVLLDDDFNIVQTWIDGAPGPN